MTDVAELLERVAEQGAASARPPALAVLRRRRARRSAVRGAGAVLAAAGAAALVLGPPALTAPTDVVVARPAPSPAPSAGPRVPAEPAPPAEPLPPGTVAVPAWVPPDVLEVPPGGRRLADLLSESTGPQGRLVTAGQRRGDRLCTAVFTDGGAPGALAGGAGCAEVSLPAYRSGRLDLGAASTRPHDAGAGGWLVLTGSAPAGTRTVVLTAAGRPAERLEVTPAGPQYLGRAWFALPWVEADTLVEALDEGGRSLAREELLLGGPQPPR